MDRYSSHLPVLSQLIAKRFDPFILEIGAGYYSTPLILSHPHGVSFEEDPKWRKELQQLGYDCRGSFPDITAADRLKWDLVFIDSSPESSRIEWVAKIRHQAKIIVLHDANPDWDHAYKYSTIRDTFKYRRIYDLLYPHTLVLSDEDDLSCLDLIHAKAL